MNRKIQDRLQPQVISFARFSSDKQEDGDSERRQLEKAAAFAKHVGLPLNETLVARKTSAYNRDHIKKGSILGELLERVNAGEVPPGSILFVEELDRLSRIETIDALHLIILPLVTHGITIQTDDGPINRDTLAKGAMWRLIGKLDNAHDESRKKSERVKAANSQKVKLARMGLVRINGCHPKWLTPKKGESGYELIENAAETIRMIFELAPKLGCSRLIKKLNAEAPWIPNKGWYLSYVRKILDNRAVLGEYQPHKMVEGRRVPDGEPIAGYFPVVIDRAIFGATQHRLAQNKTKGGRGEDKAGNLFSHLVVCPYCGGRVHRIDKGPPPNGRSYLCCHNGRVHRRDAQRRHICSPRNVRYDEAEETILANCVGLDPSQVIPEDGNLVRECQALRLRINSGEQRATENLTQIDNLIEQTGRTADGLIRDKLILRARALENENRELKARIDADRATLTAKQRSHETVENWQRSLKDALNAKAGTETRFRLRSHIKELIVKIEVFSDGFAQRHPLGERGARRPCLRVGMDDSLWRSEFSGILSVTEEIEADILAWWDDARPDDDDLLLDFIDYVLKRRMSKEGRFYRVHFRTGMCLDLVPAKGIATGIKFKDGKSQSMSPSPSFLWQEFLAAHHPAKCTARRVRGRVVELHTT